MKLKSSTLIVKEQLATKGFSLVEVVLVASLFVLFVTALGGNLMYGQESTVVAGDRARANYIVEEALEAVRNIKDSDFSNLVDGTHGLSIASGNWELSGSEDSVGNYTRVITISSVDSNTKQVVAEVVWQATPQRVSTTTLVTYLTNWQEPTGGFDDWSNPFLSGSYDLNSGLDGYKVDLSGDYAFLIRKSIDPPEFILNTGDLTAFNISNRNNPVKLGSTMASYEPLNIDVSGNYAYVSKADDNEELSIYTISNPNSIRRKSGFDANGSNDGLAVYVQGDRAYLVRAEREQKPDPDPDPDDKDPDPPFLIPQEIKPAPRMLESGEEQYAGLPIHMASISKPDEFIIIDLQPFLYNPIFDPQYRGSDDVEETVRDIYVAGNYAYLATYSNNQELKIYNIFNSRSPIQMGLLDLPGSANATAITGFANTIVVGRADGKVNIVNVTDRSAPELLGTYDAGGTVNDLVIGNGNQYVFIASDYNDAEFQVIDISEPSVPSLVGYVDLTTDMNGIAYSADYNIVVGACESDSQELVIISPQ